MSEYYTFTWYIDEEHHATIAQLSDGSCAYNGRHYTRGAYWCIAGKWGNKFRHVHFCPEHVFCDNGLPIDLQESLRKDLIIELLEK